MKKYYHGTAKRGPYFEGWYLKLQTKDGGSLALIPALHMDSAGQRSASLQVITQEGAWWLEYPSTQFRASESLFQIRLGQNVFNAKGLWVNAEENGLCMHGTVRFGPFTPLCSDIMGPFRFLPNMECSHGVISMRHSLEGTVYFNGRILDFSDGTGYVETDRGRSFPKAYLWTQCSWREGRHTNSLMLSIATIPTAAGSFTGCICAIVHNETEYRLATYQKARIVRWSRGGALVSQGKYRLAVELLSVQNHPLRAPRRGAMSRTVHESLCCRLRCRFWSGDALIFDHIDNCASFEYANE